MHFIYHEANSEQNDGKIPLNFWLKVATNLTEAQKGD